MSMKSKVGLIDSSKSL